MVVLLVRELAAGVGGEPHGDGERPIAGVSTPEAAGPTDLVCIERSTQVSVLARSRAGAAIVPIGVTVPAPIAGIEAAHPALAMARAVDLLVPPVRSWRTISPQAVVAETAFVAEGAGIAPFAVIGEGVRIGRNVEIHPGVTVASGCDVGEGTVLYAGVHLYARVFVGTRVVIHSGTVIGADGSGYVPEPTRTGAADEPISHRKIRAVGRVVIEDDVEIGANSTIHRALLAETRIGRGSKVGPLAVVGADCVLGRHCLIQGGAAITDSTHLADYATVSGRGRP
jgi:UDP-3-O-[3-hydroxymyristoyl] glucosamine N-acyltransferase